MKTYNLFTIIPSILFFLLSCKKINNITALNATTDKNPITDSLFIGEPSITNPEFIKNLEEGGDDFYYVKQFENILKKHNKKYLNYKSNESIKSINISKQLTLELKRKKYNLKNKNKDIQIVLYTKIKDIAVDSIVFYKYLVNQDDPDSRREILTYIDENMQLWHLNTYSGQSEYFVQPESWIKYLINTKNGKITKNEKLNYRESSNNEGDKKENKEVLNIENNSIDEKFSFEDNSVKWKINCDNSNPQKSVYFDKHEANFIFSYSDGFNMSMIVKKGANGKYLLYYNYPPFFPAPEDMNFNDYSTTNECAEIEPINESKIAFTWFGFFNNKTKKIERLKNPFTQKEETEPVILQKCSQ